MVRHRLKIVAIALCLFGTAHAQLKSGVDTQGFDPSVRIQDDLFLHVNGTWIKDTPIPADRSNYGSVAILRDLSETRTRKIIENVANSPQAANSNAQKIGILYRDMMDEQAADRIGIKPVLPALKQIATIKTTKDVARTIGEMREMGKITDGRRDYLSGPFSIDVGQDSKDSSRYQVDLSQGGLGMPDRDYYLKDDPRFKAARDAYVAYLTTLFKLAGEKSPDAMAAAVLKLETQMAEVQWTKVENRDPEKTYNKKTPAELAALTPNFDWTAFLAGAELSKVSDVNLGQPSYAVGLAKLVSSEPISVWQSYFKARLLDDAAPYLSKPFVEARFEFRGKALSGAKENRPRWKQAVGVVDGSFGEAIGELYVAKYFPPSAKAKMDEMVGNLMKVMKTGINELTWMSATTKVQAQRKLSTYVTKIGYPDKWRSYAKLVIKPDDLYGNVVRATQFNYQFAISKLGKSIDRSEWHMTPQTVNAYYNPSMNEIVFPAGILQPPFFNLEADDAVSYGSIGAVIGHEISHGFDDQGSQFDAEGNLKNWWTDEDRAAFKALTDKLVAQYNAYEPLPGKHINGELTLGENIADLSGLEIAYKAYRLSLGGKEAPVINGMTGDQRFFYGFAQGWRSVIRDEALLQRLVSDPHSPGHYRPVGSAANSDAFAKTFGLKAGDKMYKPENERIRIW
ncbi:MAG: M13 family metallopeptidase [Rhodocyclaceae bacterium]|jgi:putative endopeptidase|nr:M13 family metallopeptidase [Rhodocyclaceae bacterium]MBP7080296.1 M13 family metallopeptidase [Rhodocyclaceae bacterium]